jgi:hypothetical protein
MVEWSGTASLRLKSMKPQQNSFADSLVIEHKSLSELDDVHNIINWGEIEQTLSNLYTSRLVVFWLGYAKVSKYLATQKNPVF